MKVRVDISEKKHYFTVRKKRKTRMSVRKKGVCESLLGQACFVTELEVATGIEHLQLSIPCRGYWESKREKGETVGFEFHSMDPGIDCSITVEIQFE